MLTSSAEANLLLKQVIFTKKHPRVYVRAQVYSKIFPF